MPFYIQNVDTELVLDVKEAGEGADTQVIMFSYHASTNQFWEYKDGMIHNVQTGLVLDVNQETGDVKMFEPHGGPNQLWHFEEDGTIRCEIDQVLDVFEGSRDVGAHVVAFTKHGGPNQIFKIVTVNE